MICKNCTVAKGFPAYRMFNPACLHCGVRLIQRLGLYPISHQECSKRRRMVLNDWMAQGHDEATMRDLVNGPTCIARTAGE